jgi:hypothetical protein
MTFKRRWYGNKPRRHHRGTEKFDRGVYPYYCLRRPVTFQSTYPAVHQGSAGKINLFLYRTRVEDGANLFIFCMPLNSKATGEVGKRVVYARYHSGDGRRANLASRASVGNINPHHHCRFSFQPFHCGIVELTFIISPALLKRH